MIYIVSVCYYVRTTCRTWYNKAYPDPDLDFVKLVYPNLTTTKFDQGVRKRQFWRFTTKYNSFPSNLTPLVAIFSVLLHLQPRTLRPKRKRKEELPEVPNNFKDFNLTLIGHFISRDLS